MSDSGYPRDMVGYGDKPPEVNWPGNARVALQFVINYEQVWVTRRIDIANHWREHHAADA